MAYFQQKLQWFQTRHLFGYFKNREKVTSMEKKFGTLEFFSAKKTNMPLRNLFYSFGFFSIFKTEKNASKLKCVTFGSACADFQDFGWCYRWRVRIKASPFSPFLRVFYIILGDAKQCIFLPFFKEKIFFEMLLCSGF